MFKNYNIENFATINNKSKLTDFEKKEDDYAKVIKGTDLDYMREPKGSNAINPIDIPTLDYIGKKTKVNLPQILKTQYLKDLFF